MQWIRPEGVVLELCTHRDDYLDDEDDPLCEYSAALEEAQDLPKYSFIHADRCVHITNKRAWNSVGAGEIWRITKDLVRLTLRGEAGRVLGALSHIFTLNFKVVHDDAAEQRAYEAAIKQLLAHVFPEWWKALVTERDLYMTHVLHDGLETLTQEKFLAAGQGDPEPVRIVAIVGEAHVDGIIANWGKVDWVDEEVIKELWRIPPSKWIPDAVSVGFFENFPLGGSRAKCRVNPRPIWGMWRRKDAVQTRAKSSHPSASAFRRRAARRNSSPEEAPELLYTTNSCQKLNAPKRVADRMSVVRRPFRRTNVLVIQTRAKSSGPSASALGRRAISIPSNPKAHTEISLTKSQLEVLNVTFNSLFAPKNADEVDRYDEYFRQGRVYLIGTSHGNKDCAADVRRAIRRIRPDTVVVELCAYRAESLHHDDAVCEFRAAFEESKNLPNCRFVLGDRDWRITNRRVWSVVGFGRICMIAKDMLWLMLMDGGRFLVASCRRFLQDDETKQQTTNKAFEVALNKINTDVIKGWWRAKVVERDLYMIAVLHDELECMSTEKFRAARRKSSPYVRHDPVPVRIVAVVGATH
ncbi:TraB family protein, partial [Aphelenchoides avenae]